MFSEIILGQYKPVNVKSYIADYESAFDSMTQTTYGALPFQRLLTTLKVVGGKMPGIFKIGRQNFVRRCTVCIEFRGRQPLL